MPKNRHAEECVCKQSKSHTHKIFVRMFLKKNQTEKNQFGNDKGE